MADYHSPTVVTPLIPLAAITALELLVLEAVFESEIDTDGRRIYLFSETGPNDTISLDREELASAIAASDDPSHSTAKTYLAGSSTRRTSRAAHRTDISTLICQGHLGRSFSRISSGAQ